MFHQIEDELRIVPDQAWLIVVAWAVAEIAEVIAILDRRLTHENVLSVANTLTGASMFRDKRDPSDVIEEKCLSPRICTPFPK